MRDRQAPHHGPGDGDGARRPRLEVRLGPLRLKNPVVTAAGTFGYGREAAAFYDLGVLGAVTVKGLSLEPWPGNPPPRAVETPAGMLNAIGLQNPGVDHFVHNDLPWLRRFDVPVIANVVGKTEAEYVEVARRLDAAGVDALELNVSCPNVKAGGSSSAATRPWPPPWCGRCGASRTGLCWSSCPPRRATCPRWPRRCWRRARMRCR